MKTINQTIDISGFYFPGGAVKRAFPRSIEFDNSRIAFIDGLQYLIKTGGSMVKLFDMTDGRQQYRLRFEPDGQLWTLLTIKSL